LNFREGRLKLQRRTELGSGLGIVALKEEQDSKIAVRIHIIRIEREYGAELALGQIGPLIFQELLRLARMSVNLLLPAGDGLSQKRDDGKKKITPTRTAVLKSMLISLYRALADRHQNESRAPI